MVLFTRFRRAPVVCSLLLFIAFLYVLVTYNFLLGISQPGGSQLLRDAGHVLLLQQSAIPEPEKLHLERRAGHDPVRPEPWAAGLPSIPEDSPLQLPAYHHDEQFYHLRAQGRGAALWARNPIPEIWALFPRQPIEAFNALKRAMLAPEGRMQDAWLRLRARQGGGVRLLPTNAEFLVVAAEDPWRHLLVRQLLELVAEAARNPTAFRRSLRKSAARPVAYRPEGERPGAPAFWAMCDRATDFAVLRNLYGNAVRAEAIKRMTDRRQRSRAQRGTVRDVNERRRGLERREVVIETDQKAGAGVSEDDVSASPNRPLQEGRLAPNSKEHRLWKRVQREQNAGSLAPIPEDQSFEGALPRPPQEADRRSWWAQFLDNPGPKFDELIARRIGQGGPHATSYHNWEAKHPHLLARDPRQRYLRWLKKHGQSESTYDFEFELFRHVYAAEEDYPRWRHWAQQHDLAPWVVPDRHDPGRKVTVLISTKTSAQEFDDKMRRFGITPAVGLHRNSPPQQAQPQVRRGSDADAASPHHHSPPGLGSPFGTVQERQSHHAVVAPVSSEEHGHPAPPVPTEHRPLPPAGQLLHVGQRTRQGSPPPPQSEAPRAGALGRSRSAERAPETETESRRNSRRRTHLHVLGTGRRTGGAYFPVRQRQDQDNQPRRRLQKRMQPSGDRSDAGSGPDSAHRSSSGRAPPASGGPPPSSLDTLAEAARQVERTTPAQRPPQQEPRQHTAPQLPEPQPARAMSTDDRLVDSLLHRPGAAFDYLIHELTRLDPDARQQGRSLAPEWREFTARRPEYHGAAATRQGFMAFIREHPDHDRRRFRAVRAFFGPLYPMVRAAERGVEGWQDGMRAWAREELRQRGALHGTWERMDHALRAGRHDQPPPPQPLQGALPEDHLRRQREGIIQEIARGEPRGDVGRRLVRARPIPLMQPPAGMTLVQHFDNVVAQHNQRTQERIRQERAQQERGQGERRPRQGRPREDERTPPRQPQEGESPRQRGEGDEPEQQRRRLERRSGPGSGEAPTPSSPHEPSQELQPKLSAGQEEGKRLERRSGEGSGDRLPSSHPHGHAPDSQYETCPAFSRRFLENPGPTFDHIMRALVRSHQGSWRNFQAQHPEYGDATSREAFLGWVRACGPQVAGLMHDMHHHVQLAAQQPQAWRQGFVRDGLFLVRLSGGRRGESSYRLQRVTNPNPWEAWQRPQVLPMQRSPPRPHYRTPYSTMTPFWWNEYLRNPSAVYDSMASRVVASGPGAAQFRTFLAQHPEHRGQVTRRSFHAWLDSRPAVRHNILGQMRALTEDAERGDYLRWREAMHEAHVAPSWVDHPGRLGHYTLQLLSHRQRLWAQYGPPSPNTHDAQSPAAALSQLERAGPAPAPSSQASRQRERSLQELQEEGDEGDEPAAQRRRLHRRAMTPPASTAAVAPPVIGPESGLRERYTHLIYICTETDTPLRVQWLAFRRQHLPHRPDGLVTPAEFRAFARSVGGPFAHWVEHMHVHLDEIDHAAERIRRLEQESRETRRRIHDLQVWEQQRRRPARGGLRERLRLGVRGMLSRASWTEGGTGRRVEEARRWQGQAREQEVARRREQQQRWLESPSGGNSDPRLTLRHRTA